MNSSGLPRGHNNTLSGRDSGCEKVKSDETTVRLVNPVGSAQSSSPLFLFAYQIKPYPLVASGSSGALLRRKLIICGGQIPDGSAIKKCYFLTSRVREWKSDFTLSLMKPRAFAGALVTRGPSASPASGERLGWWITGGINRYSESTCKTSVSRLDKLISDGL